MPCIRQRIDCCAHRSDDGCVSLEYVNKGGTASLRPFIKDEGFFDFKED